MNMSHPTNELPAGAPTSALTYGTNSQGESCLGIADFRTGEVETLPGARAWGGTWSPDGQRVVYGSHRQLLLYTPGQARAELLFEPTGHGFRCFKPGPDGMQVAVGMVDTGEVVLVPMNGDARDPRAQRRFHLEGASTIHRLLWSPDGRRLYALGETVEGNYEESILGTLSPEGDGVEVLRSRVSRLFGFEERGGRMVGVRGLHALVAVDTRGEEQTLFEDSRFAVYDYVPGAHAAVLYPHSEGEIDFNTPYVHALDGGGTPQPWFPVLLSAPSTGTVTLTSRGRWVLFKSNDGLYLAEVGQGQARRVFRPTPELKGLTAGALRP